MTAFNRVGITAANAHTGLLKNILRGEWGFKGLESQDFIMNPNYAVLKEYALNGGTMTTFTGENTMAAVSEKFAYWITENVGQDTELMSAIKQAMTWQAYALANSNAMDGMARDQTCALLWTAGPAAPALSACAPGMTTPSLPCRSSLPP